MNIPTPSGEPPDPTPGLAAMSERALGQLLEWIAWFEERQAKQTLNSIVTGQFVALPNGEKVYQRNPVPYEEIFRLKGGVEVLWHLKAAAAAQLDEKRSEKTARKGTE